LGKQPGQSEVEDEDHNFSHEDIFYEFAVASAKADRERYGGSSYEIKESYFF
jgi:hypothetical protein